MKFSCDVDGVHIEIEAIKMGQSTKNPKKFDLYDIHLKASKDSCLMEFVSNEHHLSKNHKKLEKDLPVQVEGHELIEHILDHFELEKCQNGPRWKKV